MRWAHLHTGSCMAITTTTLPPSKGVSSYQSIHSRDREGLYLRTYSQSPQCCNIHNDARLPALISTQGWLVKLQNVHLHGVVFLWPGIHFNSPQFHSVNHAFPITGRCCIRCSLTKISHLTYSCRVWFNRGIIHTLVVSAHQLDQARTQIVIYQGSELLIVVQDWHNTRPQRCTHHHRSASILIQSLHNSLLARVLIHQNSSAAKQKTVHLP